MTIYSEIKFQNLLFDFSIRNAGIVSHDQAVQKAELEYAKYKEKTKDELSKAEEDFVAFIDTTAKSLEKKKL